MDGDLVCWAVLILDPRVIRVLLRYREDVASATERAYLDLLSLGCHQPVSLLRRSLNLRRRPAGLRPHRRRGESRWRAGRSAPSPVVPLRGGDPDAGSLPGPV